MPSYSCPSRHVIYFKLLICQHNTFVWSPWHINGNATLQMTSPCEIHSHFIAWANTQDQGCRLMFSQGGIIRSYPDLFITLIHQEYFPHHSQRSFCADFCVCCLLLHCAALDNLCAFTHNLHFITPYSQRVAS
jgi:hypothetical protein